jgi:hypothetical protein
MRLHLDWNPRNITVTQPIPSSFFYSTPPSATVSQKSFLGTGFYVANRLLLIYSPSPVVQIQESLNKHLLALNSTLPNLTHAEVHASLVGALATSDAGPIVTWLLHRNCSFANGSEDCSLNGTQRWWNSTLYIRLRKYDFLDYQARWRSMVAFCGLAVALMLFVLRHENVRWSDVSPISLFACQEGDYAIVLLFYVRRDDFDVGGTDGFALVGFWAVSIPFYFLAVRYDTANRAYGRAHSEFDPPWSVRLFVILILLTAFTSVPLLGFLVRFSYWLPQIIFAAISNHRRSVSSMYAISTTIGQLVFAGSLVKYHPLFNGDFAAIMIPSIAWSAFQLTVIILQNLYGGAFFLPNSARPARFDWRAQRPPEHTECSVCLEEIGDNQPFLTTPCGHTFHDWCLRPWMNEHADCPFCRQVLPSIDIDPQDP